MSRPRTLAVTTTRRLPFSRLIWFGALGLLETSRLPRAGRDATRRSGLRGQRDRQVLERLDVVAQRVVREAHDDLKAAVALEHEAGVAAADGGPDHVLHRRQAEPAPGDLGLVDLDLQERQAGGLLDLDVSAPSTVRSTSAIRLRGRSIALEVVAEHLDREVLAHAGDQLVEAHLDRLGEVELLPGSLRRLASICSISSSLVRAGIGPLASAA